MAAIHRRGWCDGTGGNFSCVLDRHPLRLLMAPSGVDKGSVAPEQLIEVDAMGAVLRGQGRASAETELHLALVEGCGAGAVLHTHSQAGTLLSQHYAPQGSAAVAHVQLSDLEMLKGLEGVSSHSTTVAIPVVANDQNLKRVRQLAEPHLPAAPYGLLIAGHGLYAWGRDLPAARRHLEILEFLLEQHWRQLLLQGLQSRLREAITTVKRTGVRCLLLDIEGTTCPVSFVSGTLFPYASAHLAGFLQAHHSDPEVQQRVQEVMEAWRRDPDPEAQALRHSSGEAVEAYLQWLIRNDRKLTALKDLQGMIWADGYAQGALVGPLFADVAAALRRWHRAGFQLAVYSSGSVAAQQLIYGHSSGGDLRPLFGHWFDTRIGAKQAEASYSRIAADLELPAQQVLFVSDALAECQAAASAGMQVLFSDRDGNPERDAGPFERISTFEALELAA